MATDFFFDLKVLTKIKFIFYGNELKSTPSEI